MEVIVTMAMQDGKRPSKAGHFHMNRGARVLVFLGDGTREVRKYKEFKGKFIYFYDRPRLTTKAVRTISYYKPHSETR